MPLLRTLLSALLLVLSNQVMENVIGNLSEPTPSNTPSTALESLTTTVPPSTSLPPQCPGNQVKLENSSVCSCPSGMVKDGDNCSCPGASLWRGPQGVKQLP
ncbi:Balbiani ring protein 3 [Dissostichus eleginoides]|uniref:Balbiani ring protein 3 n=1 Tax=Dissostichus eleginoides TaxID=100907 RepID=A0AAD9C8M5_DISEL|nr:Balbiani ring protein 3 [Dissostichus eleginoides]